MGDCGMVGEAAPGDENAELGPLDEVVEKWHPPLNRPVPIEVEFRQKSNRSGRGWSVVGKLILYEVVAGLGKSGGTRGKYMAGASVMESSGIGSKPVPLVKDQKVPIGLLLLAWVSPLPAFVEIGLG